MSGLSEDENAVGAFACGFAAGVFLLVCCLIAFHEGDKGRQEACKTAIEAGADAAVLLTVCK